MMTEMIPHPVQDEQQIETAVQELQTMTVQHAIHQVASMPSQAHLPAVETPAQRITTQMRFSLDVRHAMRLAGHVLEMDKMIALIEMT